MSRRQFADARWVFSSEAGKEEVGLVLNQEGLTSVAEAARSVADPRPDVAHQAADNGSASVGGSDKNKPANLWNSLVAECLTEKPAVLRGTGDSIDRSAADSLPESISAVLSHHLREDAPQAVADDDHSVESRVFAVGIERQASPPQDCRSKWAENGMGSPLA